MLSCRSRVESKHVLLLDEPTLNENESKANQKDKANTEEANEESKQQASEEILNQDKNININQSVFHQMEELTFRQNYAKRYNVFALWQSAEIRISNTTGKPFLSCVIESPLGSEMVMYSWNFGSEAFNIDFDSKRFCEVVLCNVQPTFLGQTRYINFDSKCFMLSKFDESMIDAYRCKVKKQISNKELKKKEKCMYWTVLIL